MGVRHFKNGDAHEYLDTARLSDREKRAAGQVIAADDEKWAAMARGQYGITEQRATRYLDQVVRIAEEAADVTVDQILEDMRNGEIDATEAAKALNAAKKDLAKLRGLIGEAERSEQQAWAAVDKTPAEFQADLMKRAPVLFKGRNLLALPTNDDD